MREKLIKLLCDVIETDGCSGHCNFPPCYLVKACADNLIANGVTMQKWIPVTERLPERYQNVLAIRTDGKIRFDAIGSLDVWYEEVNFVGYPVTHWMPLPEPPKGE